MADQDRMSPDDLRLLQLLEEAPFAADFYAVMRALECIYASRPRFGQSLRPAEDPIRLCQEVSLEFAPSPIAAFETGSNGHPARMYVRFLGLLGPNGPMPLHITEYIRDRLLHHGDPTSAAFVDLFHHRFLSLFYRAWADSEPTVSLDRPASDRFAHYVAALIGLGARSLRNRDVMPDWSKFHFSGALSCQTRHPDGLKAILSEFFDSPVSIEEFIGCWIALPTQTLCRLGVSSESASLGVNATIGDRVWDYQQTFRIVFGPVGLGVYERMLPGSDGLQRLIAIIRNYVGDELAWEVQLILKREEVPQIRLGHQGRLGWTTWLRNQQPAKDPGDLVLSPVSA